VIWRRQIVRRRRAGGAAIFGLPKVANLPARQFSTVRKWPLRQRGGFQPFESGRSVSAAVFGAFESGRSVSAAIFKRSKVAALSARRLSKRSKAPISAILRKKGELSPGGIRKDARLHF